jgi:hypothetical protein
MRLGKRLVSSDWGHCVSLLTWWAPAVDFYCPAHAATGLISITWIPTSSLGPSPLLQLAKLGVSMGLASELVMGCDTALDDSPTLYGFEFKYLVCIYSLLTGTANSRYVMLQFRFPRR